MLPCNDFPSASPCLPFVPISSDRVSQYASLDEHFMTSLSFLVLYSLHVVIYFSIRNTDIPFSSRQHLQKLKRNQGTGGSGSAPATPTGKRARGSASAKSSAKKGSSKKDNGTKGYPIDLGDQDDSDHEDHAAKKRRIKAE